MAWSNVRLTDRGTGDELFEIRFAALVAGQVSAVRELRLTNISSPGITLTDARLGVQLLNGTFETAQYPGDPNVIGLECQDERWIEVRVGADPFKPIGGLFGPNDDPDNFYELGDIGSGQEVDVDMRINVPLGFSTKQVSRVRLGLLRNALVP